MKQQFMNWQYYFRSFLFITCFAKEEETLYFKERFLPALLIVFSIAYWIFRVLICLLKLGSRMFVSLKTLWNYIFR